MRFVYVPFAVLAASITLAVAQTATIDPKAGTATIDMSRPPPPPTDVDVLNFPDTQAVTGSVSVDNLPAVQTVGGTVNVGNLPLDADGAVRVGNAPARQPVLVELLTEPVDLPGQSTYSSPTVNMAGYTRFGFNIDASTWAYAVPTWGWGDEANFQAVADSANGSYRNDCVVFPGDARRVCTVSGGEMRMQVVAYGNGPLQVRSITVYLIP